MNQKHFKAAVIKIMLVLVAVIALTLGALASIGVSYLTHDFNNFLFSVGGEIILLICFFLFLLVRKIRRHAIHVKVQK